MSEAADDDGAWMLLNRATPEGYPLVVLTRMPDDEMLADLREHSLTEIACEADQSLVNERGMPSNTDRLYDLEEALAQYLSGGNARHVASVTGDGFRRVLVAHSQTTDLNTFVSSQAIEGYTLSLSKVTDRETWFSLVIATPVDRKLDGDQQVVWQLQDNGDDGSVPRKVDFWFYGPRASLEKLAFELECWTFKIDHWNDEQEGFVLTAHTEATFDTFQALTPILIAAADANGETYDGWETFVVDPDEHDEVASPSALRNLLEGAEN